VRRRRRAVGALVAGAAAFAIVSTLSPPPPATAGALVAVRDIPAGTVLAAADLQLRLVPEALAPAGALTAARDAVGRAVGGSVREGEILTDARLVGAAAAGSAAGSGMAAAPVRLADAEAARLLRAGDLVDVLGATPDGSADVVAEAARVLSVPKPRGESGFLGADAGSGGALVVLEVDRDTARALAGAAAAGTLSASLIR
jgi:Flp pilus assembly protein CpaB